MPRYAVEINSYTVSFTNTFEKKITRGGQTTGAKIYDFDEPGESTDPWERKLTLKVSGGWGNGVKRVILSFLKGVDAGYFGGMDDRMQSAHSYGYYSANKNTLYFSLDVNDFADCYKILQTEKPLSLMWEIKNPNHTKPISWKLTTSTDEPLGEGDSER